MNKAQREQLKKDWLALQRACESSSEATGLLDRAFKALRKVEQTHRKWTIFPGCDKPGAYQVSLSDVTRIMILVHVSTKARYKLTWIEAAACREDILCARALREKLELMKKWPFEEKGPLTTKMDMKDYR